MLTGVVAMTTFPQLSLYTGNGDYSATNAANQGMFAINGNLLAKNYAVGTGLPPAPFGTCGWAANNPPTSSRSRLSALRAGSRNVAVVSGTSYIVNFQVNGGNFDYCGSLTQSELTVSGGNLTQTCFAFDFEAANGFLDAFSATFAAFPPTGAPTRINDQFTFTANSLYNVNVFNVSNALFDSIQQLTINAANGTFVVINIDGTNATFQNFQTTLSGGIDQQHIIYHFYQAVGLTVQAINVQVR
jgi:choice-of-anchor A domain-containing protein